MTTTKPEICIGEPISAKIPKTVRLSGLNRSRIYGQCVSILCVAWRMALDLQEYA